MKQVFFTILFFGSYFFGIAQVGINTNSPQQKVHVAGTTENIRVEGLSETNNTNNLGSPSTTRVYINANGDLTLGSAAASVQLLVDSENYLTDVENPTSLINQTGTASCWYSSKYSGRNIYTNKECHC